MTFDHIDWNKAFQFVYSTNAMFLKLGISIGEDAQAIGGATNVSQINFDQCLNERSTYCGFKEFSATSRLNSDLFMQFFKVWS